MARKPPPHEDLATYLGMALNGPAVAKQRVIDALVLFGLARGLPDRHYRLTPKGEWLAHVFAAHGAGLPAPRTALPAKREEEREREI